MTLQFTKMQALGNDFLFIDARQQPMTLNATQIRALADRHTGVGFDQLLCLASTTESGIDGIYRIFNADGQEVSQCGNGVRCVAHYLYVKGKPKHEAVVLKSRAGLVTVTPDTNVNTGAHVLGDVGYYRAALTIPQFDAAAIPVNLQANVVTMPRTGWLSWQYRGETYAGGVVNVGNPHWIMPIQAFDEYELQQLGEVLQVGSDLLEVETIFPEGVNLTWLFVENDHQVHIETYERGVGLTQACGTAAAAAAVVAISQGWCDNPVWVFMPGGQLLVDWTGEGQAVNITGEAVLVYHGELSP